MRQMEICAQFYFYFFSLLLLRIHRFIVNRSLLLLLLSHIIASDDDNDDECFNCARRTLSQSNTMTAACQNKWWNVICTRQSSFCHIVILWLFDMYLIHVPPKTDSIFRFIIILLSSVVCSAFAWCDKHINDTQMRPTATTTYHQPPTTTIGYNQEWRNSEEWNHLPLAIPFTQSQWMLVLDDVFGVRYFERCALNGAHFTRIFIGLVGLKQRNYQSPKWISINHFTTGVYTTVYTLHMCVCVCSVISNYVINTKP